jgi:hypothetical protein
VSLAKKFPVTSAVLRLLNQRATRWSIAILAILWVAVLGIAWTDSWIAQRRAEGLLRDFKQLGVGRSTVAEARGLMERHGGGQNSQYPCNPSSCEFAVGVSPKLEKWHRFYQILVVTTGVRPWLVHAEAETSTDRVNSLHVGAISEASEGYSVAASTIETDYGSNQSWGWGPKPGIYEVHVREIKRGWKYDTIRAIVTPEADQSSRQKAFGIDLSCLTGWECAVVCQWMPLAWADAKAYSAAHGEIWEDCPTRGKTPLQFPKRKPMG